MYAGRPFIGCEINPEYHLINNTRLNHAKKQLAKGKQVNDVKAMTPPKPKSKRSRRM